MATSRLDAMRRDCRLVARVVSAEIFAATLDLGTRLPPDLFRARMVCIPILISVTRDQIDRTIRGVDPGRGPSINAIAASLDLPFETARRNVQRMVECGWLRISDLGGVALPDPMPEALGRWCRDLDSLLPRAAARIARLSSAAERFHPVYGCDKAAMLGALDLFLVMASTSSLFDQRFSDLLLIHFVCNASVAHLNSDAPGAAPFARRETVPTSDDRAFIPLARIADTTGASRSTVYRIVSQCVGAQVFERRGNAVRASVPFLASPLYAEALERVAGRTATLFSRLERHRCGAGCAELDAALDGGVATARAMPAPRVAADSAVVPGTMASWAYPA
jgi:hypothetical protein